ncbi:MAG: nicotinate (nicotinamide) nucleotide adenylyltransferase [Verrucomicrobia bacterium]|nr:MAG: nicotinate (nicotinamide) nucleotide adenylyltransferase [Verrucomicrobiota bacterium]
MHRNLAGAQDQVESSPAGGQTSCDLKANAANTCFIELQKIGIYGGTFDPVHHAHLILARFALEKFALERIIFVPTRISPHKNASVATPETRLQMLRSAIESEPQFEVDDCELERDPPSYTIDTVKKLKEKHPGAHLFLLIGDDNLAGLPSWRGFEDLRHMVTFIVLQRAFTPVAHEYLSVDRRIDISATEIRQRMATGRTIHFLVPRAVEEIIRARGLYREVAK